MNIQENSLPALGARLREARRTYYPRDSMRDFARRVGVGYSTMQRMERGDLSVTMGKYHLAATILGLADGFDGLFERPRSLFDE